MNGQRPIVTPTEIEQGLCDLGLRAGETVFLHSSLSSLGYVIDGADAVIDAFLATVGPEGTVVVPTFVLEDRVGEFGAWWQPETVPSSVGIITEVFRQRPNSRRSDHPIHSVAAIGPLAERITRIHRAGGERLSPWQGSFSVGGPFDQLYEHNAKYFLLGVSFMVQTMCHYVETLFVERCLHRAEGVDRRLYQHLRKQVCQVFRERGVWPGFDRIRMGQRLMALNLWASAKIGQATAYMADIRPYVHTAMQILQSEPEAWFSDTFLAWYAQVPGVTLHPEPDSGPTASREGIVPAQPKSVGEAAATGAVAPPSGMVCVPAGWFIQGSACTDPCVRPERPQRLVYLNTFYLDRHPVTNADYWQFVRAIGHQTPSHWPHGKIPTGQEAPPVVCVDWFDAVQYAAWAGKRLPTEAEWEKAARGGLLLDGDKKNPMPWRHYPWGDVFDLSRCATTEGDVWEPTPVGHYSPAGDSPYGVADMAGNVWEWVADWYDTTYYQTAPDRNPQGPATGVQKVLRGGAAGSRGRYARCACRNALQPQRLFSNNGFRCAWSPG